MGTALASLVGVHELICTRQPIASTAVRRDRFHRSSVYLVVLAAFFRLLLPDFPPDPTPRTPLRDAT